MNTHAFMQRFCDKHWNYKMKVTQSTLKNEMQTGKIDKRAISIQSHKYKDSYKRWHKEHSEGTAGFVSILPSFWWRCYGSNYLKDRKKYKSQRGEARTQRPEVRKRICGILHSLAD